MIIQVILFFKDPREYLVANVDRKAINPWNRLYKPIFMKVCAKRICSEMFNILVHVSFANTYVNSQLQNYSDAKGGAMQ